jgi:hypothetical protein
MEPDYLDPIVQLCHLSSLWHRTSYLLYLASDFPPFHNAYYRNTRSTFHPKVNVIYHIDRIKKKHHIIFATDEEKHSMRFKTLLVILICHIFLFGLKYFLFSLQILFWSMGYLEVALISKYLCVLIIGWFLIYFHTD